MLGALFMYRFRAKGVNNLRDCLGNGWGEYVFWEFGERGAMSRGKGKTD